MIGIQKSKRTPDTEASVSTPSIDKEGDCWQRKNRRGRAERNLVKQICPEIYPRFWSLKEGEGNLDRRPSVCNIDGEGRRLLDSRVDRRELNR